jgi:tetratricopeptide (TPR) repeat protein
MQTFELNVDSAGDFKKRQLNLSLSQGEVQLESRQVKVEIADLLFSEVTGLRGICRMIQQGKNPSNAVKECGAYLYEKFLGKSIGKKLHTNEKTLLKILENKADKKIVLIPWEILRDQENYLIKKDLVVTRSPKDIYQTPSPMRVAEQLRILILASQPQDLEPLAVNKEIEAVVSIFDVFNIGMPIQVDVLTYGCTRERLMDFLENRSPYHILHYIGAAAKNKLIIENHDGVSEPLYGDELVEIFTQIDQSPYLVVFSAPFPENAVWKEKRINPSERDFPESKRFDKSVGISYDLIQSGATSAVLDFRLEIEPYTLHAFLKEFYYQLIQQNLSVAKSFHSAQVIALDQMLDHWFYPALYGGDAVNRPFIFEKNKNTQKDKKIRLTDLVDISSSADFVGRYPQLSEIAKRLIYGNVQSLCLLGADGLGKTDLAARTFEIWKNEYDGVFFYRFFPGCTLEEFWLDFRLFAIRNRLVVNLSRIELEGRSSSERQQILKDQILSLLATGRYLLILDDFQVLLEQRDAQVIFKQNSFEELFQGLLNPENRFETLICSSFFPQYLSDEPWTVSVLPMEGLKYNDMSVFCEQALHTREFLGALIADERNKFYRLFAGSPALLKFFEQWKAKKTWYKELKSKPESEEKQENLWQLFVLLEKVSPDVKKLLSLLMRMRGEVFLPLLMEAFGAESEKKIEGFSVAKKMGFAQVRRGRESFMPERIELASIIRAYYTKNPQDLEIFEREHQFYLKQYGKAAIDLGKKWIKEEEAENGYRLMLSAWDCLFGSGDFSAAATFLREIQQSLLDNCLFELTQRMFSVLIDSIQDDRERIILLRQMGGIQALEGKRQEREANYQKCLEIHRTQGNREEAACDLYELGVIQIEQGFYDKAELKLEEKKAQVLVKIAEAHWAKKDFTKAIDFYSQALKIYTLYKNHLGMSIVLGNLSEIYHKLGDNLRSMELDSQKIEVDKTFNNLLGMTRTLLHMADLQMEMEKYEEAITVLNKSMALKKHLDDQTGIGETLLRISEIKRRQGRLKDALLYCRQSLETNQQLGHHPGLAANYLQLSCIYHDKRQPEEAVKYASKSLDLYNEISDKENVVVAALHLGEIYQGMSDYEQALTFYQQGLEIKQDEKEMGAIAHIQKLIASLYYLKGDVGLSLEHYGQSLSIYKHLDRLSKIAEVLHQIATIHQDQGKLSEALELYEQSLVINKEQENLSGVALTLGQIGRILEQQEKNCKAVGKYATSLAILRHLRSKYEELATEDLTNLKNQLPEMEYKWCVTAGLEEHAAYLENIEVEGKDF